MTDHNGPCIAGRPVGTYLRSRVPVLTGRVIDALRAELPVYADLPQEELAGDIADIVRHNLLLFADVIEQRRPARDDELVRQRDSAAQRAEEGVPLDAILSAYQVGMALGWREITDGARPADLPSVQELLARQLDFLRQLLSAVSGSYLEARQILDSQEHAGRHALMTALLAGDPLDPVVRRTGLRPAPRYVAVCLALAAHPDETGAGARVAARRKIRRVQSALDQFAGGPTLTALDDSGGTALIPVDGPPAWPDLCALFADAAALAGIAITAAAVVAEPSAVPAAITEAAEVVELVRRTGRPPALYRLADVLLDYQLSRPTSALSGLAGLLGPLDAKPELLTTLHAYLRHGLDRRRAATALHVHPNTVDYRLRRIAALTGLNPARPTDLPRLNAALIARSFVAR